MGKKNSFFVKRPKIKLRTKTLRAVDLSLRVIRIQALKCIWWMPWQSEAMKDVVRCDKFRGAVNKL